MLEGYSVGEISLFGFDFAPKGFLKCEGQLLSVTKYPRLFSLIKNKFGGDGQTTFALPDYRDSVPETRNDDGQMVRMGAYCIAVDESASAKFDAMRYMGGIANFSFDANDWGNDWVPCDGRMLEINRSMAIFSLLGTRFGGDGAKTFAVPNLVGSAPAKSNYLMSLERIFPSRDGNRAVVEAILAEVRLLPYDFVPGGWRACDGSRMRDSDNTALAALLGTSYGGFTDRYITLPDLRGTAPKGLKYCIVVNGYFPVRD